MAKVENFKRINQIETSLLSIDGKINCIEQSRSECRLIKFDTVSGTNLISIRTHQIKYETLKKSINDLFDEYKISLCLEKEKLIEELEKL